MRAAPKIGRFSREEFLADLKQRVGSAINPLRDKHFLLISIIQPEPATTGLKKGGATEVCNRQERAAITKGGGFGTRVSAPLLYECNLAIIEHQVPTVSRLTTSCGDLSLCRSFVRIPYLVSGEICLEAMTRFGLSSEALHHAVPRIRPFCVSCKKDFKRAKEYHNKFRSGT